MNRPRNRKQDCDFKDPFRDPDTLFMANTNTGSVKRPIPLSKWGHTIDALTRNY